MKKSERHDITSQELDHFDEIKDFSSTNFVLNKYNKEKQKETQNQKATIVKHSILAWSNAASQIMEKNTKNGHWYEHVKVG